MNDAVQCVSDPQYKTLKYKKMSFSTACQALNEGVTLFANTCRNLHINTIKKIYEKETENIRLQRRKADISYGKNLDKKTPFLFDKKITTIFEQFFKHVA